MYRMNQKVNEIMVDGKVFGDICTRWVVVERMVR